MNNLKVIKDPIYGYIEIPSDLIFNVIDTAVFQRLRRIIQTSYSPLFPSASHNRFVHSLGVYHLGTICCKSIRNKIRNEEDKQTIDKLCQIFSLACLLHDVGHAPFSHSTEHFFLGPDRNYSDLHRTLKEVVADEDFSQDIPILATKSAAAHEIMSVIVGIQEFPSLFSGEECAFFARCITGYKYSKNDQINSLKNCFIELLNSETIDVDKLDYLIRDSYSTGFNTVRIDYERLLRSVSLYLNENKYTLVYDKSAISVIENVIYARDAERKWLQNHPVVFYEDYLLRNSISNLCAEIKKNHPEFSLFSRESLSRTGNVLTDSCTINLLGDDDIIFLMKNVYGCSCSDEYFSRSQRRHSIWKSEAEYKAYVHELINQGAILRTFVLNLKSIASYLCKNTSTWVINEALLEQISEDIEKVDTVHMDEESKTSYLETKSAMKKTLRVFLDFARISNIDFDFMIIQASQFSSGFNNPDFSKINILFSHEDKKICKFTDVCASYHGSTSSNEDYFYIFYRKKPGCTVDKKKLATMLFQDAMN